MMMMMMMMMIGIKIDHNDYQHNPPDEEGQRGGVAEETGRSREKSKDCQFSSTLSLFTGGLFESFSLVCKCFLLELWSFPVE